MSVVSEHEPTDALSIVRGRLVAAREVCAASRTLLVGVSGPVASGKSRFSHHLRSVVEEALGTPVTHIPFDYWINPAGLHGATYAERFFLGDFAAALDCIAIGRAWMCPRFDLAKQRAGRAESKAAALDGTQLVWQNRTFWRTAGYDDPPELHGGNGVYFEPVSDRLFTLVVPQLGGVCLIDGTLIFYDRECRALYHTRVYIRSSWAERVARMVRRYNRREVFGQTSLTRREYVGFLVHEGRSCADAEIEDQIDEETIVVRNRVETLSHLLDLYALREEVLSGSDISATYNLDRTAVDGAIAEVHARVASASLEHRSRLAQELDYLVESKHLLSVSDTDAILDALQELLGERRNRRY
jgi:hypothetical protein